MCGGNRKAVFKFRNDCYTWFIFGVFQAKAFIGGIGKGHPKPGCGQIHSMPSLHGYPRGKSNSVTRLIRVRVNDFLRLSGFTPSKSRSSDYSARVAPIGSTHSLGDNLHLVDRTRSRLLLINFLYGKNVGLNACNGIPDRLRQRRHGQHRVSCLPVKDIP